MSKFESYLYLIKRKALLILRNKAFYFTVSWIVLSLAAYIILCFDAGKVGIPPQFQKTLTIDRNAIYGGNLEGFEIRDDFLIANDEKVRLSFKTGVKEDKFKYATIFVNLVNINENVNVHYKVKKGGFTRENN
ncbi:MAG: hypothetical protein LBN20_03450, partial [Endomicrobium sp.]|nr:hypothetical protein [Endomicrobium sp.]